ncbi:uncharacterized protein LOC133799701 [Humulus lupulus]|uniref:uncharacterized protein LOC133799701 n=1 Tax=Humulus lupulus TaxID=3486 RepID=UPI002B408BC2|nr:uncharacterized protein LOC133799701 [Humulus lupulus]
MIREPAGTPPVERPSVPLGKGKKKVTEPVEDSDESSDENDMDSVNVFDIYKTPKATTAPSSKKKTSKRHHEESSKAPQAKKPRNAGPPEDRPSATTTPSSPREQKIPPAPAGSTPPPAAPTDQTQQADPAMLTLTASRICSGAVTEQARTLEQRHEDELKAAEEKYAEQLAVVLEEKAKLAKELEEKQRSLDKAHEKRDQFKESNSFNFRAAQQLEVDLKHNQGANFDYLPENARDAEIARCAAQLAEEERSRVPASPEISLAAGMDGADNEAAGVVDQGPPQDPLTA